MEASRIGTREQRLQLASVFASFSDGWFLASRQARIAHEIETALASVLSVQRHTDSFQPLARDFLSAFGDYAFLSTLLSSPVERLKEISAIVGPTIALIDHLAFDNDASRQRAVQQMTKANEALVCRIRHRRERACNESGDFRFRMYSALLFLEMQDKIEHALKNLGETFADLKAMPDEAVAGILDLVPCLDVERSLALQTEKQRTREIEGNDVYDIAALTAAVPYCDLVVTEKLWKHLCAVSKLGVKYRTTVLSSLDELQQALRDRKQ